MQPVSAMLASDPDSCPCCQDDTGRRPSGLGSSSDSGQEGSGSAHAGVGEGEAGTDVARTSEDGASSELGKEDEEGPADGAARLCEDLWRETRAKLRGIVDSKYFNRGIMVAILTNTLSMGVEYHEQVGAHTDSLQSGPGACPTCLCLLQALASHGLHRGLSGVGE